MSTPEGWGQQNRFAIAVVAGAAVSVVVWPSSTRLSVDLCLPMEERCYAQASHSIVKKGFQAISHR